MGHESRREFFSAPLSGYLPEHLPRRRPHPPNDTDLGWPFGTIEDIDEDDIRETAYEIFFTACRSSPGFGGRTAIAYYSSSSQESNVDNGYSSGTEPRANGVAMSPTSRVKRALGLKMLKRSHSKRGSSVGFMSGTGTGTGSGPSSPKGTSSGGSTGPGLPNMTPQLRPKRPLTCAEIMRQQMRVTEQSDNRLRKTLMRTLVGQMGRRAETIILPLELLRHLKPSEFNDAHEYHIWQKRQLKILEAGLLLHPSVPTDKSNAFVSRLKDIIRSAEMAPIDTGKNSDTMRTLCNSVVSLSWRSANGAPTDVCHWADGYPMNIHLYVALLQAIFDIRDETSVLDEVDELLELMKKTWSTFGINTAIHHVCLTWVFFHQYVETSQLEPDLLSASHAMLAEVAIDAKKPDRSVLFLKIMSSVLTSIRMWSEKRLLSYHEFFQKGTISLIENLLPLALTALKIMEDEKLLPEVAKPEQRDMPADSYCEHVDNYIRSSLKTAFQKVIEFHGFDRTMELKQDVSEAVLQLAKETEDLALNEKEWFSPLLKRWHPMASGVAAVTLHGCYAVVLKHYLTYASHLNNETVEILQRAGKLEKFLVQMVVEDSAECEDGGKAIVREMVPYEVETVIVGLVKKWIGERLQRGKDYVEKAKEVETWNPKSKTEPYAQSSVEIMKLAKETVNEFFEIPVAITEDLVLDLADALGQIFEDYINALVQSCGSKQNYLPVLPPLTRCHQDSAFIKLCKRATPCSISMDSPHHLVTKQGHQPRPSTSRGTQRLYIRLNTLHYLLTHLYSLDKTLAISRRDPRSSNSCFSTSSKPRTGNATSYFDGARSSILTACQAVSEVAASRLIFLDSSAALYDTLYIGDVSNARIQPALRILKQNITLLCAILTERAQPLAIKEIMKASFEAFLRVLLAGGNARMFYRTDHEVIAEDFAGLKRTFSTCGEGLMNEDVMEKEADIVEGVIALMGETTEQLIDDYNAAAGVAGNESGEGSVGQKLQMPPTAGKWRRTDPNTIIRVLCHRVDRAANQFLKRSFQLSKRR